jgi:hypothetical protein
MKLKYTKSKMVDRDNRKSMEQAHGAKAWSKSMERKHRAKAQTAGTNSEIMVCRHADKIQYFFGVPR